MVKSFHEDLAERRAWRDATNKVCAAFAAANGWKLGSAFSLDDLMGTPRKNQLRMRYEPGQVGDHLDYFRLGRRPVAMLSPSYLGTHEHYASGVEEVVARHKGHVVLHVPPAGKAVSWYYPGGTLPQLLTRPDVTTVIWPTIEAIAAMGPNPFARRQSE